MPSGFQKYYCVLWVKVLFDLSLVWFESMTVEIISITKYCCVMKSMSFYTSDSEFTKGKNIV